MADSVPKSRCLTNITREVEGTASPNCRRAASSPLRSHPKKSAGRVPASVFYDTPKKRRTVEKHSCSRPCSRTYPPQRDCGRTTYKAGLTKIAATRFDYSLNSHEQAYSSHLRSSAAQR